MISDKRIAEAARRSMESSANLTHVQLKRGLNALATIGATAPFVGLFGTVIGIMNSFRGTTAVNLAHFSSVSGGISEALVTTSLGLLVAVPAVWAYNYFRTRLELLDIEMNNSIDAISTYLSGFQAMKRNR
jgi:biopolymer transport protein ExbB/biopolymer transport protein TolQ